MSDSVKFFKRDGAAGVVKVEICQSTRDERGNEKGGEITVNWPEERGMVRRRLCVSTPRAIQAWVEGR